MQFIRPLMKAAVYYMWLLLPPPAIRNYDH